MIEPLDKKIRFEYYLRLLDEFDEYFRYRGYGFCSAISSIMRHDERLHPKVRSMIYIVSHLDLLFPEIWERRTLHTELLRPEIDFYWFKNVADRKKALENILIDN